MRIFEINGVPYGSTGRIMLEIKKTAEKCGHTVEGYTGYSYHPIEEIAESNIKIGSKFWKLLHIVLARVTGLDGCFSFFSTIGLLKRIKNFKPDVIHLHNIHGNFVNLPLLFRFIKNNNIRTVWTLHDCWAFTGHCPYFDIAGCSKWKSGCHSCSQYKGYPESDFDNSKYMYKLKKKWFTGVNNLNIITPSKWLADIVKQSFLSEYPVKVINNGINLDVFKPTYSDFRKKYNCEDKYILLGVAFGWGKRKGLDVFINLSKKMDSKYQIVLVGTDENTDKLLPDNIISIHRTQNAVELAEIYTAADLFVNPTREENFPTVNLEALACGTPVVTFDTGGSPEGVDVSCGSVVPKDDIDALYEEILKISIGMPFTEKMCREHAEKFNKYDKFSEYILLYEKML